ncbi:hypothetical protein ACN4EE_22245 [Geminocystis sp. CENA526]|uniref:hypothetical protein n=1 Tax=Geminocystis sp. CENA526 TaxID=1355871 RepID=UPI003D6EC8C1
MIDLQLIAQNLIAENKNLQNALSSKDSIIDITASKLASKYSELKVYGDSILIRYKHGEKGIYSLVPYAVNCDKKITFFSPDNKEIFENAEIVNYSFSEQLNSVTIKHEKNEIVISAVTSKTCLSKIAKSKDKTINGVGIPDLILLDEKIIFTLMKDLPLGQYKITKNHGKKSKTYNDLLVDIESISNGEQFKYVAVNTELSRLIAKYKLDCKFEVMGYENFLNSEDKNAVKTVIKDLNFSVDLTDFDFI